MGGIQFRKRFCNNPPALLKENWWGCWPNCPYEMLGDDPCGYEEKANQTCNPQNCPSKFLCFLLNSFRPFKNTSLVMLFIVMLLIHALNDAFNRKFDPILIFLVDGGWGNWSEWTNCTPTCGESAIWRYRECNNPPPQYGGLNCTGNYTSSIPCDLAPCPG